MAKASGRLRVKASERADSRCADYCPHALVDLTPMWLSSSDARGPSLLQELFCGDRYPFYSSLKEWTTSPTSERREYIRPKEREPREEKGGRAGTSLPWRKPLCLCSHSHLNCLSVKTCKKSVRPPTEAYTLLVIVRQMQLKSVGLIFAEPEKTPGNR